MIGQRVKAAVQTGEKKWAGDEKVGASEKVADIVKTEEELWMAQIVRVAGEQAE